MSREETREIDECDMEEFGTPDSSEKTIASLGNRWHEPQAAKHEGDETSKNKKSCTRWKQRYERPNWLEVPLLALGTVLPSTAVVREAWSVVRLLL